MSSITLDYVERPDGSAYRLICKDGIPLLHSSQYLRYIHVRYGNTNTSDTYAVQLFPFYKWLDNERIEFLDITRIHLQQYLNHLRTLGLDDSTVRQYMSSVLRFVAWCMEPSDQTELIRKRRRRNFITMETRGLLAGIVHRDVEYVYDLIPKAKKKVPPVITEDELSLIRGWIMQTFSDDPSLQCLYRCIIELLWDGALRRGELLALNLNSLQGTNLVVQNLPEKFDAVWAKKIGAALKTGERTIPIDKATVQWIHKWKTECRPAEAHKLGHGLLLTNLHPDRLGEPFTINALKWLFNRINHPQFGVQVPGKTLHPHMFRHTFATMALDDDLPFSTIQYYLGHKSINSTQIYTHLADSKVRKDLEAWRKKRQYRYGDLAI